MGVVTRSDASAGCRWSRVAASLLVACCLALLAGRAAAAAPEDRCLAAAGLAGLTPDEQRALTLACSQRVAPTPDLAPLLVRLAARADWQAAALGDLLAAGAPLVDLGPDPAAAARLQTVRQALQRGLMGRHAAGCKSLHAALGDYFAARDADERVTPPFAADTLAGCVPAAPDLLAAHAFLAIPADDPATDLFVAASVGDRVVLQWYAAADAVAHAGRRVFVVPVPRWSVVTARAASPAIAAPQLWHGYVTYDRTLWDLAPAAGCLRVSVDLDPGTALLLDGRALTRGQALAHRTVGVHAGAHELVAVRCDDRGCAVRFRETLPAAPASATQNLCQDVALDLHQRRSVALLQVRAAPGCDEALAWRAGQLAADHLRRNEAATGRVFRDLASYASITRALGALRDGLNPGVGAAAGADTGGDSLELVASVAKEAWRQGIDELVTLELRCTGDPGGLTLQGTAISVRDAFDRSLGPVAGLDLKHVLRVQSLGFRGEAQLASTVAGVVDQLFARSYLRFREGATRFAYRRTARVELVANGRPAADGVPVLAAHHIAPTHRGLPDVCAALRGDDPARARAEADALAKRSARLAVALTRDDAAHAPEPDAAAATTRLAGSFRATHPGTYLVTARWRRAGVDGPLADAVCVRFDVPLGEVWTSVTFAPDLTLRTPITAIAARHVRALAGFTWYRPRPWLGLGGVLGYTYTRFNSDAGLPAWMDFAADPVAAHDRLGWRRHAIVTGPLVEFRTRHAGIPLEFRARVTATVGLAIINVGDLTAYPAFTGDSRFGTSNLRLRPTVDATLELGVGGVVGPVAITPLIMLGAAAINDMFDPSWAISATGGAALFTGFGLHLGGAP